MVISPFTAERRALAKSENVYLNSHGWRYRSFMLGGYSLWRKKLSDGRIILVEKKTALRIQANINDSLSFQG